MLQVFAVFFSMQAFAATIVVTNTNDSGAGSLRQAITDAQATAALDVIEFNIPGAGVHTLVPMSPYPTMTKQTVIDGSTQPGYAGMPLIEIDGTNIPSWGSGFYFSNNSNCEVKGMCIHSCQARGIYMINGTNMKVTDCIVGMDPTGTIAKGNVGLGISFSGNGIVVSGCIVTNNNGGGFQNINGQNITIDNNIFGLDVTGTIAHPFGTSIHGVEVRAADNVVISNNIISGNSGHGIFTSGTGTNLQILNNKIGSDVSGDVDLGNVVDGINLSVYSPVWISGNIIGGNGRYGLSAAGNNAMSVYSNFIGVSANSVDIGNDNSGIYLQDQGTNTFNGSYIGDGTIANANSIAYNGKTTTDADGVSLRQIVNAKIPICGNNIYANSDLGIDLAVNGVTMNDTGDGDSGANNLVNFPVINSAVNSNLKVDFDLDVPAGNYVMEVFGIPAGSEDPSGYGEGNQYLGSFKIAHSGSGVENFVATLAGRVPLNDGDKISMTTTICGDPACTFVFASSEFSMLQQVVIPPLPDGDHDGIADDDDLDDDNDGVLDGVECEGNRHPVLGEMLQFNSSTPTVNATTGATPSALYPSVGTYDGTAFDMLMTITSFDPSEVISFSSFSTGPAFNQTTAFGNLQYSNVQLEFFEAGTTTPLAVSGRIIMNDLDETGGIITNNGDFYDIVLAPDTWLTILDDGTQTTIEGTQTGSSTPQQAAHYYIQNKSLVEFQLKDEFTNSGYGFQYSLDYFPGGPCFADKDGDNIPDNMDLDSDNDGIPDLVEAGGVDIDGDGKVDGAIDSDGDMIPDFADSDHPTCIFGDATIPPDGICDSVQGGPDADGDGIQDADDVDANGDGLPDMYDPNSGGVAITDKDSDNDGLADRVDLDADGDGIPDAVEAGGPDVNMDGIIDNFVDSDGDGFNDAVDGDVGNDGPENTANAMVLTGADTDMDGIPDTYPQGDFDGDKILDFLDIDSDNDGITDNTEWQATDDYIAPINMDADEDGIDDAYDTNTSFGGGGLEIENTDMADMPDYLDLDADNDGEPDMIEGHDTNGDGVVDGTDLPVSNTGLPGGIADLDGDGLLDGFDNDTADTDATNMSLDPSAHNDTDDPGIDQDWRQGICALCKMEYALQDGANNQTTTFEFDITSNLLIPTTNTFGKIRSNKYCDINGWRYFYNPASPTEVLFAMRGMPSDLDLVEYIEIRVGQNASDREAGGFDGYSRIMNRDWFVQMNTQPTSPMDIRFYFPGSDFGPNGFMAADNSADNFGHTRTPSVKWWKASFWDSFDPTTILADASNLVGMPNYEELIPATATDIFTGTGATDGTTATVGNGLNFVQFDGLTSFSGGTAGFGVGGSALPVELTSFDGYAANCKTNLNWTVETETVLDRYEIQWSEDGEFFETIEIILKDQAQSDNREYNYFDSPNARNNYYRLKFIDLDGSFGYSEVINLITECDGDYDMTIYPNPVRVNDTEVQISFYANGSKERLTVLNALGQFINQLTLNTNTEEWNTISIDITDLPKGVYFVKQEGNDKVDSFIIQ